MRKRLITPTQGTVRSRGEGWLDVERAAIVEITSEDKNFPVESAFASGETQGWRAAMAGTQTIRLIFDQPQRLKKYRLSLKRKKLRGRKNSSCAGLLRRNHFLLIISDRGQKQDARTRVFAPGVLMCSD
jgi:hypothetical protein